MSNPISLLSGPEEVKQIYVTLHGHGHKTYCVITWGSPAQKHPELQNWFIFIQLENKHRISQVTTQLKR